MKKIFISICTFLLVLGFFCLFNTKVNAQSGPGKIDCLVCNPGEDCSTELRFAWKSTEASCYFYITSENDTEFAKAKRVKVDGSLNTTAFPNKNSDEVVNLEVYTYEHEEPGLVPGTKYLYKVTTLKKDASSSVHNAKTAELDGSFNFILIGDNHLTCASWSKRTTFSEAMIKQAISQVEKAGKGSTDLMVSTGDVVAYGSYYDDHLEWNEGTAAKNFVYASSPGNHDYYSRTTGSSVMTDLPYSWEASMNMPDNSFKEMLDQGIKSNSYFLYNSCLFISIDSIASKKYHDEQAAWIKETVAKLEGQYQWLIVYEHYPFFDGETAADNHYSGSGYKNWWKVFDEVGVDLALSGDSHVYLRSKPLKDNKVDPNGTVYMTCPQIGDRYRFIESRQNDSWMEVRIGTRASATDDKDISKYGLQDASGLGYVMITPTELTYCLIDTSYQVKDTYTITARRELPEAIVAKQNVQNEALVESFEVLGHNGTDHEALVFDSGRLGYMASLEVKMGNETIVASTKPTTGSIDLGNLEDNKVHELDVKVNFINGTSKTFKVYGSTYPYYGTISNFKVNVRDGKTVLTWDANVTSTIAKYEVYEGTTLLGTSTTPELALDAKKDLDVEYTLKAYTVNNELIYTTNASYKLIGDINYDGSVDVLDCDEISRIIFENKQLTDTEKVFGDLNNDGAVDFEDAIMVMLYTSNKIDKTFIEDYTVSFKDDAGVEIATVMVQYGDDAEAPTPAAKDGYTFIGWSKPVTNVTSNLVVYAIYQKNN